VTKKLFEGYSCLLCDHT